MSEGVTGLIDFNRIRQPKVRNLLMKNGLYSLQDLAKLKSLCFDPNDGRQYNKHVKVFSIYADIQSVWETYKFIKPEDTWCGNMVSFGMMYSRKSNSISFPGDPYNGLEAGQILYLNLNLVMNKAHLAVGHEVTGVFDDEKKIRICYLQNGASMGTQIITLHEITSMQTQVFHETWYRSDSFIRDRFLYPTFHTWAITEFHNNVKRIAETRKTVNR